MSCACVGIFHESEGHFIGIENIRPFSRYRYQYGIILFLKVHIPRWQTHTQPCGGRPTHNPVGADPHIQPCGGRPTHTTLWWLTYTHNPVVADTHTTLWWQTHTQPCGGRPTHTTLQQQNCTHLIHSLTCLLHHVLY